MAIIFEIFILNFEGWSSLYLTLWTAQKGKMNHTIMIKMKFKLKISSQKTLMILTIYLNYPQEVTLSLGLNLTQ